MVCVLEHQPYSLKKRLCTHHLVAEHEATLLRYVKPREHTRERGFPSPVGADQSGNARFNIKGTTIKNGRLPFIGKLEFLHTKKRIGWRTV